MKTVLYEWVRNLVCYQLLSSVILNILPGNMYQKYVRFFLGMLFIMITLQPVLELFDLTEQINREYVQEMIERELEENLPGEKGENVKDEELP